MSNLTGILGFAGDKAAQRINAVADVATLAEKAICHGDTSRAVSTLKALEKAKTDLAKSVREELSSLTAALVTAREQGKAEGLPEFSGFTHGEVSASGKKSAAVIAAVKTWASGVAELWLSRVDTRVAAMKQARDDARAAKPKTTNDVSENKETNAPLSTANKEESALSVAQAEIISLTAERDALREEVARLQALLDNAAGVHASRPRPRPSAKQKPLALVG